MNVLSTKKIPLKTLLSIYPSNRQRLELLTVRGSLTGWLNDAIREKLDRDVPIIEGQLPDTRLAHMEECRAPEPLSMPPVVLHTAPAAKPGDAFWDDEAYERTKSALRQLRR